MKNILLILCAWPLLSHGQAPAPIIKAPSESVLAQFPRMTGFRLSPDGKHLLAIESQGDSRNVLVWRTEAMSAKPNVIGSTGMQVSSARFIKNDVLAVDLVQPYDARMGEVTKTFISKFMLTDLEGKNWREPLQSMASARTETDDLMRALARPALLSTLPQDPDHVIMLGDGFARERDMFRYNVRTGASTRIMRLADRDQGVYVDRSGVTISKRRAGSDAKGAFIALEFRNASTGAWDEHFRTYLKDREITDLAWASAKSGKAVIRTNVGREFTALMEYDIGSRKFLGTLFEHQFFDAENIWGSLDQEGDLDNLAGFVYAGPYGRDVHWEDPAKEAVINAVGQSLGLKKSPVLLKAVSGDKQARVSMFDGATVRILDFRKTPVPTYLIQVDGLSYPTEYYMLRGQQLTLLSKAHPEVDRRALGQARMVYYKARDGLNIPAFLTQPNPDLCGAGPYAAVVHPHGGPWSRDNMGYDRSGWVPLMVSRCMVVLQPQFRGSANLGKTLWLAGDAEWGQKMQDDKDDGAKWLVSEKLADPKRVAMFGFSYGGYAAFAAAVRPNDLYKCAIAGAGVSDIDRIGNRLFSNPYFRDAQEPTMRGLSPLAMADKIKIPIMVYHGERDQTVPVSQSDQFVQKAKASTQPVEYHVLADYGHGPAWRRETMTRQLQLISNYFRQGCGGGGL
jgi:dipeptidyl aminopeptidase/acylaminoacyl peptidase